MFSPQHTLEGGSVMKKQISRRKFLTYTLGATAGFLASGVTFSMIRFAVDPLLKKEGGSQFIDVNTPINEITDTPKAIQFIVHRKDGWYNKPGGELMTAWVMKDKQANILALSPVCKHLGCTVNWNSNPSYADEFFCPCHFGRYYKDGTNVPGTPPTKPLDHFETKVSNNRLLINPIIKA